MDTGTHSTCHDRRDAIPRLREQTLPPGLPRPRLAGVPARRGTLCQAALPLPVAEVADKVFESRLVRTELEKTEDRLNTAVNRSMCSATGHVTHVQVCPWDCVQSITFPWWIVFWILQKSVYELESPAFAKATLCHGARSRACTAGPPILCGLRPLPN